MIDFNCPLLMSNIRCYILFSFLPTSVSYQSTVPQPIELDQNVETIGGTFVDEERSLNSREDGHGKLASDQGGSVVSKLAMRRLCTSAKSWGVYL